MSQKWQKLLLELVLPLNTSESKAIKCTPYKVVFASDAVLPVNVRFDVGEKAHPLDVVSAKEFLDERESIMIKQCNRELKFNDYMEGDNVRLKVKFYKTGENRKLAPRRGGPWVLVRKLPNGVNFEIKNIATREVIIVHQD